MIGALGLSLVGVGIVFIYSGWKGRRVGEFFDQLRGTTPSAPAPTMPTSPTMPGPILPPADAPTPVVPQ